MDAWSSLYAHDNTLETEAVTNPGISRLLF